MGLQRWNSTSPAKGSSLGGGYLLYYTDKNGRLDLGIAIDPGFDFIKNLFHQGFSLRDIDIVLLSHAHLDHIRDFESMITLLLELKKRTKKEKIQEKHKLHAIMTLGVYSRLEHIITSPGLREFIDPYIIDIKKEIFIKKEEKNTNEKDFLEISEFDFKKHDKKNHLTRFDVITPEENKDEDNLLINIKPTIAYHDDFSQYSDSFGFIITVKDKRKNGNDFEYKFGYTGDTSWDINFMEKNYQDCSAILVHLGSLISRTGKKAEENKFLYYNDRNNKTKQCFKLVQKKGHPYFVGILHFMYEIKEKFNNKTLVLMSEFGEELRGKIRLDFVKRINKAFPHTKLHVLPVDVGLDVHLRGWKNDDEGGD